MNSNTVSFVMAPIVILIMLLVAAVPVMIGIYVFRDAKKRNMNAALWTLLAILAPSFIGLIIYLCVRGEHPDKACPGCGRPVREQFAVCPYCGKALKEHCEKCDFPLESGWMRCPNCGNELPAEQQSRLNAPPKKEKGIWALLAIVLLIPVLICILLLGAFFFSRSDSLSNENYYNGTTELENGKIIELE